MLAVQSSPKCYKPLPVRQPHTRFWCSSIKLAGGGPRAIIIYRGPAPWRKGDLCATSYCYGKTTPSPSKVKDGVPQGDERKLLKQDTPAAPSPFRSQSVHILLTEKKHITYRKNQLLGNTASQALENRRNGQHPGNKVQNLEQLAHVNEKSNPATTGSNQLSEEITVRYPEKAQTKGGESGKDIGMFRN